MTNYVPKVRYKVMLLSINIDTISCVEADCLSIPAAVAQSVHPDPKLDHDDNVYSTRRHTNTSSAAPCELRCCWLLRHRSAHPRVRHRSCQLHCQPSSGSPPSYQLRQHCAALCGCSRPDSTDRVAPCADAAQEAARHISAAAPPNGTATTTSGTMPFHAATPLHKELLPRAVSAV